jgi:hypothetical protein
MSQEADGPVGFANSLKMACTTADTSIAADERMFLQHKIEAQDCQAIGKGETGAKPITVSFYVKADSAKTYGLEVFESNSARQCTKLFNVTTDWTRVVLTFPADVDDGSSPIPDTTAEGIVLQWQLHAGSNFTSGTLNSSAFADSVNANRAVGIDSFYSSTSNTFFITGIQLEVGDTATDFEHRSFGDELLRCQRYFNRMGKDDGSNTHLLVGGVEGTSNMIMSRACPVSMRAVPTCTLGSGVRGFSSSVGVSTISSFASRNSRDIVCLSVTVSGSHTLGQSAVLFDSTSNGFIDSDAEL